MTALRDIRESSQLFDELGRIVKEQDDTIKALHKTVHHYASEIVKINRSVSVALAALQSGQALDVAAAICILRGD